MFQLSIEQHNRPRTMVPRIDCLRNELRMLRESVISSLLTKSGGFIAQYDDNLVFHIQSGIVVVVKFICGSAVSGKDQRRVHLAGRRETEGNEILFSFKLGS